MRSVSLTNYSLSYAPGQCRVAYVERSASTCVPARVHRQPLACRATIAPPQPIRQTYTAAPAPTQHSLPIMPTQLAYEMVQGPLVRFSRDASTKDPPTAVLVHGILGSRRNLQSFARQIVQAHPQWQILLVDLRCHGESYTRYGQPQGHHSVESAAADVTMLLRHLKLFPHSLIGHSFGGKVVMSMAQQFGTRLPRPVQVWVLDALPGQINAGGPKRADHPREVIAALRELPTPIASRNIVIDHLTRAGFSSAICRWMATNLRPCPHNSGGLDWTFDLEGIAQMYASYEASSLWGLLQAPPQGLKLDFVRAERSNFRWGGDVEQQITALGHGVHLLPDSGHWVHTDNPTGLYQILAPTFRV